MNYMVILLLHTMEHGTLCFLIPFLGHRTKKGQISVSDWFKVMVFPLLRPTQEFIFRANSVGLNRSFTVIFKSIFVLWNINFKHYDVIAFACWVLCHFFIMSCHVFVGSAFSIGFYKQTCCFACLFKLLHRDTFCFVYKGFVYFKWCCLFGLIPCQHLPLSISLFTS